MAAFLILANAPPPDVSIQFLHSFPYLTGLNFSLPVAFLGAHSPFYGSIGDFGRLYTRHGMGRQPRHFFFFLNSIFVRLEVQNPT